MLLTQLAILESVRAERGAAVVLLLNLEHVGRSIS
jgi:hypothetical protein